MRPTFIYLAILLYQDPAHKFNKLHVIIVIVPPAPAGRPPPTPPSSADTSEPASDSSHTPPFEPGSPVRRTDRQVKVRN